MKTNNLFSLSIKSMLMVSFLLLSNLGHAQTCTGTFVFGSQAEVDRFIIDNPSCRHIIGDVYIIGDDINSVEAFRNIEQISGLLYLSGTRLTSIWGFRNIRSIIDIEIWNVPLYDLDGFINLSEVGNSFYLMGYSNLSNLNGLYNLHHIPGLLYISATPLSSFEGNRIVTVGKLILNSNYNIVNLSGLENLTTVYNGIYISGNTNLNNLSGCTNLHAIEGNLYVHDNINLASTKGMNAVQEIGIMEITNNPALGKIEGFINLRKMKYCAIQNNPNLERIIGLPTLTECGFLFLYNNPILNNISAFNRYINLQAARIENNRNLAVCNVITICNLIGRDPGLIGIENNAEGCLSVPQVESQCHGTMKPNTFADLGIGEELNKGRQRTSNDKQNHQGLVYPNPCEGLFNINLDSNLLSTISVYSQQGELLNKKEQMSGTVNLNISDRPAGVYLIQIQNEMGSNTIKLLKY